MLDPGQKLINLNHVYNYKQSCGCPSANNVKDHTISEPHRAKKGNTAHLASCKSVQSIIFPRPGPGRSQIALPPDGHVIKEAGVFCNAH